MTTVSREIAKAVYIAELVREHIPTLLSVLVAAGERDLAGRLASRCGTTEYRELGDRETLDELRAQGIRDGLGRSTAELCARIRAELARGGIPTDSPEAFSDAVARLAREREVSR